MEREHYRCLSKRYGHMGQSASGAPSTALARLFLRAMGQRMGHNLNNQSQAVRDELTEKNGSPG